MIIIINGDYNRREIKREFPGKFSGKF